MNVAASLSFIAEGSIIGQKYRVLRVVAQGGMGIVALCQHEELEQRVALKLLLPETLKDTDSRTRFVREARAAAKLQSQHVARVSDVGTDPVFGPYLVMEYLVGSDLNQLISSQGRLPVSDAVDYVLQAIDAVAEAHSLGIIHRDLKPANLFLADRSDGSRIIKVLDFGISKVPQTPGGTSAVLTSTKAIIGSPGYMAPEQLTDARSVDGRSDVWALGVVCYELLAATRPFQADSMAQLFVEILEKTPVHLAVHRPAVPPPLAGAVMRCLSKDPRQRFANVAQLARAIADFGSRPMSSSIVSRASALLDDLPATSREPTKLSGDDGDDEAGSFTEPLIRVELTPPAPAAAAVASPPARQTYPSTPQHPFHGDPTRTQAAWDGQSRSTRPGRGLVVALLFAVAVVIGGGGAAFYTKRIHVPQSSDRSTAVATAPPTTQDTSAPGTTGGSGSTTTTPTTTTTTATATASTTSAVAAVSAPTSEPPSSSSSQPKGGHGRPPRPATTAGAGGHTAKAAPTAPVPSASSDDSDFLNKRH